MVIEIPVGTKSLWASIIRNKFEDSSNCQNADHFPSSSHSSIWKGISQALPLFGQVTKLSLGCGNKIRFWFDPWVDSQPLSIRFSLLFHLSSSKEGPFLSSPLILPIRIFSFAGTSPIQKLNLLAISNLIHQFHLFPSISDTRVWSLPLPIYSQSLRSSQPLLPLPLRLLFPINRFGLPQLKSPKLCGKMPRIEPLLWILSNPSNPTSPFALIYVPCVYRLQNPIPPFLSIALSFGIYGVSSQLVDLSWVMRGNSVDCFISWKAILISRISRKLWLLCLHGLIWAGLD